MIELFGAGARVIEVYLDQHPAYAAFNSSSVNTLRIWVLRRDGVVGTRLAFLRIGHRDRSWTTGLRVGSLRRWT